MSRLDQFEKALETLIEQFNDVSNEEIADSLDFYSTRYRNKAEQENDSETD